MRILQTIDMKRHLQILENKGYQPINKSELSNGNKLGYFLTYLLIASSGIFHGHYFLGISFIFTLILFIKKREYFDKSILHFIILLFIMVLVQTIRFEIFFLGTTAVLFVRFLFPYFAIKIIGRNFTRYYVNIIYLFTIISLIFYLSLLLLPGLNNFLLNLPAIPGFAPGNFFTLYQTDLDPRYYGISRNHGPFGEPGVFAFFLILALLFNTVEKKSILDKRSLVFIIGIITTLSTSGYIALFVIIIFFQIFFSEERFKYVPILFIAIAIIGIYFKTPLLHEKIKRQFKIEMLANRYQYAQRGRFISAKLDLIDIRNYPFFGRGRNVLTRFDDFDEVTFRNTGTLGGTPYGRTNGITDFMIKYGLIVFAYYFILLTRSLKAYNYTQGLDKVFAYFMLATILITGFSQVIFQRPIMIALVFMFVLFPPPYSNQTKLK